MTMVGRLMTIDAWKRGIDKIWHWWYNRKCQKNLSWLNLGETLWTQIILKESKRCEMVKKLNVQGVKMDFFLPLVTLKPHWCSGVMIAKQPWFWQSHMEDRNSHLTLIFIFKQQTHNPHWGVCFFVQKGCDWIWHINTVCMMVGSLMMMVGR